MLRQALSYLQGRKFVEERLDAIAAMPAAQVRQQFAPDDGYILPGQEVSQMRYSSAPSGQDNAADGSRSEKRHRVLISARLVDTGTLDAVRVRDISNKGARVFGIANCECGAGVVLGKGEVLIPAQVVWRQNGEAGLRFDRELSAGELDELIPGLGSVGLVRRGSYELPMTQEQLAEGIAPADVGDPLSEDRAIDERVGPLRSASPSSFQPASLRIRISSSEVAS